MVATPGLDLCGLTIDAALRMLKTIKSMYAQINAAEKGLNAWPMFHANVGFKLKLPVRKQDELRSLEEGLSPSKEVNQLALMQSMCVHSCG